MREENQIRLDFAEPEMTPEEALVWNVLRMCKGKSLAILGPEIEELTGIKYKTVQKIINDLRCHHAKLIGSGTRGYYLPQTREEMTAFSHYMRDRAIMALFTIGRQEGLSLEEVFEQGRLKLRGEA